MEIQNSKDWAKVYRACGFIEKGVCEYADERVYLSEETLIKSLHTIKGRPVIIDHMTGITPENMNEHAVGYVVDYEVQGACDCKFVIFDDEGKQVIADGYSVSCAYKPKSFGPGGTWHNVPYDREITDLEYTHLALVQNPRYEDAKVYENAKDGDGKGRWITIKGTHVFVEDGQSVEDAMKEHGFGKSSSAASKKKSDNKSQTRWVKVGRTYMPIDKDEFRPSSSTTKKKDEDELVVVQKGDTSQLEQRLSDLKSRYSEVMKKYWEADEDDRDLHQYKADAIKDEMLEIQDRLESKQKQGESYHRQKEDEDLLSKHGEIQKQKEELLKKLKATDDIEEGDKILAQIDELGKQQDELGRQRLDIAKEAYLKSKKEQGDKGDNVEDFVDLEKDEKTTSRIMDDVDDSEITKHINKIKKPQTIEEIGKALGLSKDQYASTEDKASPLEFRLLSMQRYGQSVLKTENGEFVTKKVAKAMKEEKNNSIEEEQLKEENMKVDEFFNKMGEMIEEKLNACKSKMNEGEEEKKEDDDDKFEMDGETYSKKELVNAWKEKKNAEESEEKSKEKSEEESEEKSNEGEEEDEEKEKQNSGDEFFNAMEERMQQQASASDKIEVYSQAKGLEKGRSIYTK